MARRRSHLLLGMILLFLGALWLLQSLHVLHLVGRLGAAMAMGWLLG